MKISKLLLWLVMYTALEGKKEGKKDGGREGRQERRKEGPETRMTDHLGLPGTELVSRT